MQEFLLTFLVTHTIQAPLLSDPEVSLYLDTVL